MKEVVKGKGKIVKTVETMSIENRWEMANRPVVYWSHEVGSNIIWTKLELVAH